MSKDWSENSKSMLAGGFSGVIGKTITAPLSRLTIIYQVTPLLKVTSVEGMVGGTLLPGERSGGVWKSLYKEAKHVFRTEGFASFWKGNLTSVLHRFPYSAINFSSFEAAKKVIKNAGYDEGALTRLVCGAYAGGLACASAYPLDLIRTRLTIQASSPTLSSASSERFSLLKRNSKIITIMSNIVAKEGIRGLYRGLSVALAVSVPNLAIGFSVYGTAKEYFLVTEESGYFRNETGGPGGSSHSDSDSDSDADGGIVGADISATNNSLNWVGALSSGAIGGLTSSILIFPMDVLRRRMQVVGILASQTKEGLASSVSTAASNDSVVTMFKNILRTEGARGFYRGILPELLKVIPMVSVTFSMYEFTLKLLNK